MDDGIVAVRIEQPGPVRGELEVGHVRAEPTAGMA